MAETRRDRVPDWRPCEAMLHHLPDEPSPDRAEVWFGPPRLPLRLLGVPGLGADCFRGLVTSFEDAFAHLGNLGWKTEVLPLGSVAGVTWNAARLAELLRARAPAANERIVLLTHSKGIADVLEMLRIFPGAADRLAAVVSLAGAVRGSPLARFVPAPLLTLASLLPGARCELGEAGAMRDMQPDERAEQLAGLVLPPHLGFYSLAAFVSEDETSAMLRPFHWQLARIDPRNDGQMFAEDQLLPGSRYLGALRADHLAVAIPLARRHPWLATDRFDRNAFPREVLVEAIVRQVEEDLLDAGLDRGRGVRTSPHAGQRPASGAGVPRT